MAALTLPTDQNVGYIYTLGNGKQLKLVSKNPDVWDGVAQWTGGGGSVDPAEVQAIVDQSLADANVPGQIDAKIEDLNLGNSATTNHFVSSAAPQNNMGQNGDVWFQTA